VAGVRMVECMGWSDECDVYGLKREGCYVIEKGKPIVASQVISFVVGACACVYVHVCAYAHVCMCLCVHGCVYV
jgi:hypothetical protein